MLQKLKGIFFLAVILILIVFYVLSNRKTDNKLQTCEYFNELCNISSLEELKFKKIYSDPAYKIPYTIIISFKSLDTLIPEKLKLYLRENIDTVVLKKNTWLLEYKLYFSMESINAKRYSGIKTTIKETDWWIDSKAKSIIYASPFLDIGTEKNIVTIDKRKNGRVACTRIKNTYFILLECWG